MCGFLPVLRSFRISPIHWLTLFMALFLARPCAEPPVVTNVRASQLTRTELVDVYCDVSTSVPPRTVAAQVSADNGATFAVNTVSLMGDVGGGLQPGVSRLIIWNAGADGDGYMLRLADNEHVWVALKRNPSRFRRS